MYIHEKEYVLFDFSKYLICLLLIIGLVSGCATSEHKSGTHDKIIISSAESPECTPVSDSSDTVANPPTYDLGSMLFVDNELAYLKTSYTIDSITAEKLISDSEYIGEVLMATDPSEIPKDNMSTNDDLLGCKMYHSTHDDSLYLIIAEQTGKLLVYSHP